MGQNLQPILIDAIERFNALYPDITIEPSYPGKYDDVRDTIKNELAGGTQPHLAYCYPDHVALYNVTKKVVPLDAFIESTIEITREDGTKEVLGLTEEQIDNFIDGYYAEGAVFDEAGTMYTLPMSKSTEVLYYNKTFFDTYAEEYGLKVPTTWEEMEDACEKILKIKADKNLTSLNKPLGYDSEANWFITMCEQYGSNYTSATGNTKFLFNNKKNREFVQMFREWYDKGYFTTQELYGSYTSDLFKTAGIVMCIGSSAGATHQVPDGTDGHAEFDVAIAPIPQINLEAPKAISQGPSLVMFDQANKQEVVATWLFAKFLTTDAEFQASFSMVSGYIPVIEREALVEAIPDYGTWLDTGIAPGATAADPKSKAIATTISVALSQQDAYFVSPAFNGSSKARDVVGALMQFCFVEQTGDIPAMIEQAFKDAIAECVANS